MHGARDRTRRVPYRIGDSVYSVGDRGTMNRRDLVLPFASGQNILQHHGKPGKHPASSSMHQSTFMTDFMMEFFPVINSQTKHAERKPGPATVSRAVSFVLSFDVNSIRMRLAF